MSRVLLPLVPVVVETHEAGIALAERYGFSIDDAMIAASVILGGCDTLWSEDMQHGTAWQSMIDYNPANYFGDAPGINIVKFVNRPK